MTMLKEERRRKNDRAAVTDAEVFCVKCITQTLKAEKVPEGGAYWREVTEKAEKLLLHHREEIRDMYRNARTELRKWILEKSGAEDAVAFQKMQELGLTGNVAEDMEVLGVVMGCLN